MARTARIVRETSESHIELELNLDGTGKTDIDTSVPFYNHMMTALGKHSLIDLTIHAHGDTDIDVHHTVEDTAIVFGEALRQALGDKRGIRRFADATVPLDEASFILQAGMPEYQVFWLSRLLPEGHRPTACSVQVEPSALLASLLQQPDQNRLPEEMQLSCLSK